MEDPYIDDEAKIAAEQDEQEIFDSHALQRPISELPEAQPIVTLCKTASVAEAIQSMTEKRVGIVLVVEDEKLVGVFSERDVLVKVAGAATAIDTANVSVSELMTPNPQVLRSEHALVYALNQMAVGGFRHVPIVDEDNRPVAVVSMRDIVDHIVSLYPDEVLKLPPDPDQSITLSREGA